MFGLIDVIKFFVPFICACDVAVQVGHWYGPAWLLISFVGTICLFIALWRCLMWLIFRHDDERRCGMVNRDDHTDRRKGGPP